MDEKLYNNEQETPQKSGGSLLNLAQLSDLTGIDRRRISDRLKSLPAIQGKQNARLYLSHEALPLIYNNPSSKDNNLEAEKLLLTAAKREMAELALQEKQSILINAQEALDVVSQSFAEVRTHLMNLPSASSRELSIMSDPIKVQSYLEEKIALALAPIQNPEIILPPKGLSDSDLMSELSAENDPQQNEDN